MERDVVTDAPTSRWLPSRSSMRDGNRRISKRQKIDEAWLHKENGYVRKRATQGKWLHKENDYVRKRAT